MPRKSKTPRRSTSARKDFESESTLQTNGNGEVQDIKQEAEEPQRPRTNWAMVDPSNFPGFTIQYHTGLTEIKKENKKKRKRDEESERIMQDNPFDKNLSTIFSVKPADFWEDTSRYRKFTIMNETFAVNDTVFIKSSEDEDPDPDAPIKGWVARVLEVRAGDEQHVYLRIYWLYRPEDLPGGRRDYHGRNELIASNDMQIIDAMTVNAKANVRHWVELEDKSEVFPGDQLFWRQTYNLRPKGRESPLSFLTLHCIDEEPCNPDRLLIQCSNPGCKKWLHAACIESAAVKDVYESHGLVYPDEKEETDQKTPTAKGTRTSARTNGAFGTPKGTPLHLTPVSKKKGRKKKNSAVSVDIDGDGSSLLFKAEVIDGSEAEGTKTRLVLTDLREGEENKTWEVDMKCLICGVRIEEVELEQEQEQEQEEKEKVLSEMGSEEHEAEEAKPSLSGSFF